MTGKGRGVEYQKSSIRARPARSIPFSKQFNDRPAYDTVVNGRPARMLYFSRETKKEEGGGRVVNMVTISNNDIFKNRKNKAAIDYWPGK
jgi:hypothetical protein